MGHGLEHVLFGFQRRLGQSRLPEHCELEFLVLGTLEFLKSFWTPKLWIAAGLAFAFAFFLCLPFKEYTPLPEFWVKLNSWLFLLSGCNTVFHEAGHVI